MLQPPSPAHPARLAALLAAGLLVVGIAGIPGLALADRADGVDPQAIRDLCAGPAAETQRSGGEPIHARVALCRFYAEREERAAWTAPGQRARLDALVRHLAGAREHGLRPDDYHRAALLRLRSSGSPDDRVALELLATDAYLTYAAHLVGGRLDPVTIEPDWTASRRERDLVAHLERALAAPAGGLGRSLRELEPDAPGYRALVEALAMYRAATREGGWEPVPDGPALKLGSTGPRVEALRARLRATALLAQDEAEGSAETFDIATETAVAAFQRRLGLEADGVVGAATLAQLNRTAADRVEQIRANLERWRWLPEDLGERHIRVNIADFRLEARSGDRIERVHDVVVGKRYRKTPVFSGTISYVVLNPWWETPPSLARQDKLPMFRKDPGAVERLGFEVLDRGGAPVDPATIDWSSYGPGNFPFRLRQRPGPQNALGQVKLMFPNPHNVYLHDTPSRELFRRGERALSSGCVRVRDPLALTAWVLEGTPGWSRERIDAAVASEKETRVDVRARVPVHLLYFTAVREPDGSLRLIADVYDRDARLTEALGPEQAP